MHRRKEEEIGFFCVLFALCKGLYIESEKKPLEKRAVAKELVKLSKMIRKKAVGTIKELQR